MELPGSRKANLREARTSKLYPTRKLHFQIVPNAGEAGTSKLSGFWQSLELLRESSTIWKCSEVQHAGWAQFGSAAWVGHNLEVQLTGWAQFGSAAWVGHNLEAPASHAGWAQFKRTRFSRAGYNLEVQLAGSAQFKSATCGLGTIWKCPLLAGLARN